MDLRQAISSSRLIISSRRNIGYHNVFKENLHTSIRRRIYNMNISIPSKIFKISANRRYKDGIEKGWCKYETIILLNPTLSDELRDEELARFESFLHKEEAKDIDVSIRGRYRLQYPIKGHMDGIYVLYTYCARRAVSQMTQVFLSTPLARSEDVILRHMTFAL